MKTFLMALGLVAVVAAPAFAQRGADRAAVQRGMNAPLTAEQGVAMPSSGQTSWQFEPSPRLLPEGN